VESYRIHGERDGAPLQKGHGIPHEPGETLHPLEEEGGAQVEEALGGQAHGGAALQEALGGLAHALKCFEQKVHLEGVFSYLERLFLEFLTKRFDIWQIHL